MVFGSNVQPKRRVRQKPLPWLCACGEPGGPFKLNPAHLKRCPDCGLERQSERHAAAEVVASIATPRARAAPPPVTERTPAHAVTDRTEFRCACGYGIILTDPLPTCPMCQAELWEQITGPPISTSRRRAA
jgi:hypothetical protein